MSNIRRNNHSSTRFATIQAIQCNDVKGTPHRNRFNWKSLPAILALFCMLLGGQLEAHAFGGEDPALGPFHHEEVSENATTDAGFSVLEWTKENRGKGVKFNLQPKPETFQNGEVVAWHADYIDSYLYNPLWWAKDLPSMGRLKASLSIKRDLEAMHFDDLFDSDKVRFTWRRYLSGAVAGLIWAAENDDVPAAQNILGISMHAMQDFYSHSNWIDDPARRNKTLFEIPVADRSQLHLYTGAYEHDEVLGIKHHGKFMFQCSVFTKPGVKQIMSTLCGPGSPLGNLDICKDFDSCEDGISVTPEVQGVKLPPDALYLKPGMAIDTGYTAAIGVDHRGLKDITPQDALKTALTLAERQSLQWIQTLDKAMAKAGYGEFWKKVKTGTPPSVEDRHAQFENFSKFPFQFMSAGEYPSAPAGEQYFLRLKVTTGSAGNAGTGADIKVRADDGPYTILDYMHHKSFVLAYNDFERGSQAVYSIGPFSELPKSVTFYNDSATNWDVAKETGKKVVEAVVAPFKLIGSALKVISGKEADWIESNHRTWMPEDLANITSTPQMFRLICDGGDRGNYNIIGYISKTGESGEGAAATHSFKVRIATLQCVKESKWDRGSSSDEPFVLMAPSALPGDPSSSIAGPFSDVDTREERTINTEFNFTVNKAFGMINVPVSVMEHDDESSEKRDELLEKFMGIYHDAEAEERGYLDTIGAAIAEDWQLGSLEVTAWTRNGQIKVGRVHSSTENKWIGGKKSHPITFNNPSGLRDTGISTDELMPYIPPGTTEPSGPGSPTDPGSPTNPGGPSNPGSPPPGTPTNPGNLALLDKFVGKWAYNWGTLTLTRVGNELRGTTRRYDSMQRTEINAETMILTVSADGTRVEGPVTYGTSVVGPLHLKLGADGDTFSGLFKEDAGNPITGRRIKDGSTPGTPGNPGTPGDPTVPTIPGNPTTPGIPTVPTLPGTPTNPGTPTVPSTPTTPGSGNPGGSFRPLGLWGLQLESMRVARGDQIEVIAVYKNTTRQRQSLGASEVDMLLTDSDGIGHRNIGNLYRASGDPDMEPERLSQNILLEPGAQARTLALFDIPKGMTPLKTLTVFGYRTRPLTFNVSGLTLPDPYPALKLPIPGAVGGNGAWNDMGDFQVRFDGIRRGRNNALQVFLTTKNISRDDKKGHPGFGLDVAIIDQDGITITDEGNMYRASGEGPELEKISHGMWIAPLGETTVCYPVNMPRGASAKQLLVKYYGDRSFTVNLPTIP